MDDGTEHNLDGAKFSMDTSFDEPVSTDGIELVPLKQGGCALNAPRCAGLASRGVSDLLSSVGSSQSRQTRRLISHSTPPPHPPSRIARCKGGAEAEPSEPRSKKANAASLQSTSSIRMPEFVVHPRRPTEDVGVDVDMQELEPQYSRQRSATVLYGTKANLSRLAGENRMSDGKLIDYVLVARVPDAREEQDRLHAQASVPRSDNDAVAVKRWRKREAFLHNLGARGLVIEDEFKPMGEEGAEQDPALVFYKLHAPFALLLRQAEKLRLRLPMADADLKGTRRTLLQILSEKVTDWTWWAGSRWIRERLQHGLPEQSVPYSAVFRQDKKEQFLNINDEEKFFTPGQRSLLVARVLDTTRYFAQPETKGIRRLVNRGAFVAAFPLHDGPYKPLDKEDARRSDRQVPERELLRRYWASFRVFYKSQPLNTIRRYFGEKIAIYFAWLGYYTNTLKLPAVIGMLTMIYGLAIFTTETDVVELCNSTKIMCPRCDTCSQQPLASSCEPYKISLIFDNGSTIIFSVIMAVWSSMFLDFWKRKCAEIQYEWNVRDYSREEHTRPEFRGVKRRTNRITGEKNQPYYPKEYRYRKYIATFLMLLSMVVLVCLVVVAVIVYRLALLSQLEQDLTYAGPFTSVTAALINLVGILILNALYTRLAVRLTEWENHQTESEHDYHLTWKIFLFQFVNKCVCPRRCPLVALPAGCAVRWWRWWQTPSVGQAPSPHPRRPLLARTPTPACRSYASLFYIAFFKGRFYGYPGNFNLVFGLRQDECPPYGCFLELTIHLAVIMFGQQVGSAGHRMLPPPVQPGRASGGAACGRCARLLGTDRSKGGGGIVRATLTQRGNDCSCRRSRLPTISWRSRGPR